MSTPSGAAAGAFDTAALLALARDALLLHADRGDAARALDLLLYGLAERLGHPCTVREDATAWTHRHQPAGAAPDGTAGSALAEPLAVPVERLGRRVGTLWLHGAGGGAGDLADPGTWAARLDPVMPTLAVLLPLAAAAAAGGPRLDHLPETSLIRAALAGADAFVWEWLIDSDWLSDIDEGMRLLGYPAGQGHTQADWDALIHPEDRAANHDAYLRHARGEADAYEHAYRIRAADGSWRWMLERGRIVERHADGRPRRMVGTQTDVTERRRTEAAAQQAAQAQADSRAKTEFLARMSHELRTPLNAVLGFAQLMELDRDEPLQPGQQRRLTLIREAGEHLLHMINDLLDLTRIESGGLSLRLEPVALRELAAQTLDMVRPAAEKAQLRLVLEPGPALQATADRTRLRQVLLNLLMNAIKYNRPGGEVRVEVALQPDGRPGFTVRDTGQGIREEVLAHIFEPFQRGDQAGGPTDGAGIGLAVTRALVALMGGEIGARSVPGVGSAFTVALPPVGPATVPDAAQSAT